MSGVMYDCIMYQAWIQNSALTLNQEEKSRIRSAATTTTAVSSKLPHCKVKVKVKLSAALTPR